ncbi:OB-fold-containig protein [Maribacter aquivivus]|uniref:OB-fold-containig protein n=1 Tax=Maribacter aquivivus TaxID=228958 RepID=UPI002490F389|nr:OB-fold-containig protein [Maribacter aquivivus]
MNQLIDILFSEVNITLTLLLILLLVYWIITMIGGLDFDLDIDVDIDVDVDADIDFDSGIEGGNLDFEDISNTEVNQDDVIGKRRRPLKWWQIFLIYFNFVGLPFMFTFTCWIFVWWLITTLMTTLTFTYDNFIGFIIMIAALFPALFVNKLFTTPFKGFFKQLNKDGDAPVDFLGRQAILLSNITEDKMGNAEVKADGNSHSIYVKSLDRKPLTYGSSVLIIKRSADHTYFLVQSYNQ